MIYNELSIASLFEPWETWKYLFLSEIFVH